MKRIIYFLSITALTVITVGIVYSCKQTPATSISNSTTGRGEPTLVTAPPEFDEANQTFTLTLRADSTKGATVTYYLLDGDSLLMQNNDGLFKGVAPLEEGYNVRARVEWEDTTIVTPTVHVLGFIIPREAVEKLSADNLQRLLNEINRDEVNAHIAQDMKLTVVGSQMKPSLLHDVFLYLENKVWESVAVTQVNYDDYNFITSITLKPVEHIEPIVENDGTDEFYDEY